MAQQHAGAGAVGKEAGAKLFGCQPEPGRLPGHYLNRAVPLQGIAGTAHMMDTELGYRAQALIGQAQNIFDVSGLIAPDSLNLIGPQWPQRDDAARRIILDLAVAIAPSQHMRKNQLSPLKSG